MILTDELCDRLCAAAKDKSRELGVDISFAVNDENGLPRVYRRYGEALVLSITLVPGKAYTAAVTQCKTKEVASAAAEGAPLMAIQTNDPKLTLVAGGYPLFVNGKIAGGIGVGGGTEEQDCTIAEYVVSVFEELTAYPIFVLSAYSLIILIAALPLLAGRLKQVKAKFWNHSQLIKKISSTNLGTKYLNDHLFRSSISIYQGMVVNFAYMLFRFVTAIQYRSVWFFSMAVYYLVLCVMKAHLVFSYRCREQKGPIYEIRCYRRTARMLFLLNIPMAGMIVLMIQTDSGFTYPGYLIYLSALYTFYMMILSIINLIKFRKMGSSIISAAKVLNFVSALMSVLGLQTAMISRFSFEGEAYRKMMNTITGTAVFTAVMVTVIVMLIRSSKSKKEVERDEKIRK